MSTACYFGSSPRAWGTHRYRHGGSWSCRFIPTGVGNSRRYPSCYRAEPVHPHGRGELITADQQAAGQNGSSPRAWGTREGAGRVRGGQRFIPTGVGNSPGKPLVRPVKSVHPHGRGELMDLAWRAERDSGSSPRAWGTPGSGYHSARTRRFIPTGVGNSLNAILDHLCNTVHPHGRGELKVPAWVAGPVNGSSPRAWGTHESAD